MACPQQEEALRRLQTPIFIHKGYVNLFLARHYFHWDVVVYAQDMPNRLPTVLLIRQLAQQCLFALLLGVRAVAVAIIWLAVLPWVTVWTWRMYFSVGDSAYAHRLPFSSLHAHLQLSVPGGSVIAHVHPPPLLRSLTSFCRRSPTTRLIHPAILFWCD
jgi:hypothetical protein